MHLRSLERFPFDSVLLPYSVRADAGRALRGRLRGARGRLRRARRRASDDQEHHARRPGTAGPRPPSTWYEPLREQADIDLAVHWVLGRPGVFLNTVGDVDLLPKVLAAAERFAGPPVEEAVEALLARQPLAPLFV